MSTLTDRNFGILIAYLIPGFLTLHAMQLHSPTISQWLGANPSASPTVGGFLYVSVVSIAAGMLASTLRWLVLDRIHHRFGVQAPDWDFSRLQKNIDAFDAAVQHHYRYYQFYGNTLVVLLVIPQSDLGLLSFAKAPTWLQPLPKGAVMFLLFVGSRDALAKYYQRARSLVSSNLPSERRFPMTNGSDHGGAVTRESAKTPSHESSMKSTDRSAHEAEPAAADPKDR